MKNKLLLLVLPVFYIFTGCGSSTSSAVDQWLQPSDNVKVLSTIAMIDDLVAKIGGEYVDHIVLMYGEVDPHTYELVKGDDEKFIAADIVFSNGLGLEHSASVKYYLDHHSHSVFLGETLPLDQFLYAGGLIDPHIWMDIGLWVQLIDPIVDQLSQIDPDHQDYYFDNGRDLKQVMLKKDQELLQKMQNVPEERRYLVTSHDAFSYFARKYMRINGEEDWAKRFIAPEGLSPEGQVGFSDIRKVVNYLCKYQIDVVFPELNVGATALKKISNICKEKGLHITIATTPLYGDTMLENSSYLDMIEHNINTLTAYLNYE